jgi:hypothetical protein
MVVAVKATLEAADFTTGFWDRCPPASRYTSMCNPR